jgi:hypothetical protein
MTEARASMAPAPRSRVSRRAAATIGAAVVVAVLAVLWFRPDWLSFSKPALAFSERDWILIADFENLTGDKVFDRCRRPRRRHAQSRTWTSFRAIAQAALQRMRKPAILSTQRSPPRSRSRGVRAVLACVPRWAVRTHDGRDRPHAATIAGRRSGRPAAMASWRMNDLASRRGALAVVGLSAQGVPLPLATTASLDALRICADSLRVRSPCR